MIKHTVNYENLDGHMVTEDLYFHLSLARAMELEQSTDGGIIQVLQDMLAAGNGAEIMAQFRKLVEMSYGTRTPEGKFHSATPEEAREFIYSPAFDALIVWLVGHPETAKSFVEGMVSKEVLAQISKVQTAPDDAGQAATTGAVATVQLPAGDDDGQEFIDHTKPLGLSAAGKRYVWDAQGRQPTTSELTAMHPDHLREMMKRKMTAGAPTE